MFIHPKPEKEHIKRKMITAVVPPLWAGVKVHAVTVINGPAAKTHLIEHLVSDLFGLETVPAFFPNLEPFPLQLKSDALGCPRLYSKSGTEISISFSYAGTDICAAVTNTGRVGIDMTVERDFKAPYPYGRAFSDREWRGVDGIRFQNKAKSAAMLWSIKESVVKALTCGFHYLDPLDIEIDISEPLTGGYLSKIKGISDLRVWTQPRHRSWLSITVVRETNAGRRPSCRNTSLNNGFFEYPQTGFSCQENVCPI